MRILDKSKPYGIVCGATNGARFEQDGVLFNSRGEEMGAGPAAKAPTAPAPIVEVPKPAPGADSPDAQIAQQIGVDLDGDGTVDVKIDPATRKVRKARK